MPLAKIPINTIPWQNLEALAVGDNTSVLINGYLDKSPQGELVTFNRAGMSEFIDFNNTESVDGVYWWDETSMLIAVTNRNVYNVKQDGTTTLLGTGLIAGNKVKFTSYFLFSQNKNYLFMANGGKIFYTDGTIFSEMQSPDAPQYVTDLSVIDTILIANDFVNHTMRYSDPLDPFTWPQLNAIQPDTLGDTMQTLKIGNRYIYLFGRHTTDIFYSTGDQILPFSRVEGMSSDFGIQAIHSLAKIEAPTYIGYPTSAMIFIDQRRYVVSLTTNVTHWISKGIDSIIQSFGRVDDAIGNAIKINAKLFYILTFPSENRTFVYDFELQCWYEWAVWDDKLAVFNSMPIKSITYAKDWGIYVFGSSNNSKLYYFDKKYFDDDGNPIRIVKITGHVDHGNLNIKKVKRLTIHMRRGFNDVTTGRVTDESGNKLKTESGDWIIPEISPAQAESMCQLQIRYQDENMTNWSNAITVPVRNNGIENYIFRINRVGMYRDRQYEFTYSGATPFILVQAEEDVEVLSR